jgi:uncharacterized membrane protein YccC
MSAMTAQARHAAAAPALITRSDIRLALTAGLSAGLMIMLGLPDPFYASLAVGAAMGGTVGATRLLGTQRMLGTVLGGVIVAIGFSTMASALPMPLGVGVALGLTRLFGGSLGLRSGYKVAGIVVTMGWTVHAGTLSSWIPDRLVATLIGVLAAWWAVRWIWPSRALEHHLQLSRGLFRQLAELLRERASLSERDAELPAAQRVERRNQLLASTLQLQAERKDARLELGRDPIGQRLERLWDLEEQWLSSTIGLYRTLLRLPLAPLHSPSLRGLVQAENDLLRTMADRLELWAQHWPEGRWLEGTGQAPTALASGLAALEQAEAEVFEDAAANTQLLSGSGGRRAITCQQLHQALMAFEAQWQAVP